MPAGLIKFSHLVTTRDRGLLNSVEQRNGTTDCHRKVYETRVEREN
jgi:hypothetical protein